MGVLFVTTKNKQNNIHVADIVHYLCGIIAKLQGLHFLLKPLIKYRFKIK